MAVHTAAVELSIEHREALVDFLRQLADDELTLGHRDSEWLGFAPDVEEDVAFSSIAQDEVGHAVYYLDRLAELGEGAADVLAFQRDGGARRNANLVERVNGDWAYTILRHFCYDVFDTLRLRALTDSSFKPLAQGAEKMLREERYHLLHMESWVKHLGRAGGEARERLQAAVEAVWRDLGDLFSLGAHAEVLVRERLMPVPPEELLASWVDRVGPVLTEAGLSWPGAPTLTTEAGRVGVHGPELQTLLDTMRAVYHLNPETRW
ncbi:phenylacetate-CoA oxygenase subunit PaaI [Alicyclobacillus contaminans]|uniref:1,2-phenylacetyl-CoA epoxidase subunit PaaC n=1 Tax=Alicyclobacillus contaminans TaxID=392016 RepID=UPI000426059F|nr:1,2-phenylacetyl-CoA epoxidase subunit PaaC [Alicyclobacillus contaminans]GMA49385.1 phenylacetate-CoA oxygenase subunit PaaI [Alicyclobacillus contaminans]